jgi:hypothetical protein
LLGAFEGLQKKAKEKENYALPIGVNKAVCYATDKS